MNLNNFIKMQEESKSYSSPYCNPSFLNDFVCIPDLLEGLPDELIKAEQFWFYCTSSFTHIDDAVQFYFHGIRIGKW